jgi:predicted transcriptional regulator
MGQSLEVLAFLANSENRVSVLQTLATAPHTRAELAAETDVARATLSRILSDLEARELIEQHRDGYAATPRGAHLMGAVRSLIATIDALDRLDDLVRWFPAEDLGLDVGRLHDATVVRPDATDNVRPLTRSLEHIQQAERVRLVASQHAPPALEALWRATVVEARLTLEMIAEPAVLDAVFDSDTEGERMRELVASDGVTLYCKTSLPACNCVDNDGTIIFALRDHNGAPQALVESDAPGVREWFDAFFTRTRAEATLVPGDDLPP